MHDQVTRAALDRLGLNYIVRAGSGGASVELPRPLRSDGEGNEHAMLHIAPSQAGDRVIITWRNCLELSEVPYPLEAAQAVLAANRHLAFGRFEMDQSDRAICLVAAIAIGPTADLASALQLVLSDMQQHVPPQLVAIQFAADTGIVLVEGSQGRPELELADLIHLAGGPKGVLQLASGGDPAKVLRHIVKREGRPRMSHLMDLAGGVEGLKTLVIKSGRIPQQLLDD